MDSWQNLGKFFFSLNDGRDVLPDNVKQDVHKLTDGLHDVHDKSFTLYDYLPKKYKIYKCSARHRRLAKPMTQIMWPQKNMEIAKRYPIT
jgi:hypothetical protein